MESYKSKAKEYIKMPEEQQDQPTQPVGVSYYIDPTITDTQIEVLKKTLPDFVISENPNGISVNDIINNTMVAYDKKALYAAADFENFKRNAAIKQSEAVDKAVMNILNDIIAVSAEMDIAKAQLPVEKHETINIFQRKFTTFLLKNGIAEVPVSKGDIFDSDIAECLSVMELGEEYQGKIIDIAEKGYTLNDKIVKFPKVIVGK